MSLVPSCENLYFPAEPRDNVLALRWSTNDAPLEPNTSVIFKVKCTAPQLFHVLPRYGAILLADATGALVQSSNKATEITFGLRENHAGTEENNNGGGGVSPSAMNRASTARPSRASSAAPGGGGPTYQERFAIEYVVIKSEPLAFQQIFNTLADHGKLTEVVKSMWSLVASGAIPRAHLGVQASINMKVFMENVVLNKNDPAPNGGEEVAKIVVPAEARLVVPSAHVQGSHTSSRHQLSSATSRRPSETNPSATNSTPPSSRRKAVDELRALKEEINLMRRDSSTLHSTSSPNATAAGAPNTQSAAEARQLMDSLSPPQKTAAAAAAAPAAAIVEGEEVIMTFDLGSDGASSASKKKTKGLKVYLVLAMMFILYTFLLIMRRGATHSVEAITAGTAKGKGTANPYAVQISSRSLEKSES
jgi:hypothetical protein